MITIHTLKSGLAVVIEEMPYVESVAYDLLIPGGIICDEDKSIGSSLILAESTCRGADGLSSKDLSDAFEDWGIRHGESSGHDRFVYRGSMLAGHLDQALSLVSRMVTKPDLPADEIESIRSVLLQDIQGLYDNPARRVMVELASRYYPKPYDRSSLGLADGLDATDRAVLLKEWKRLFRPRGSVLSVAGKVKTEAVLEMAENHFGVWEGEAVELPSFGKLQSHQNYHIDFDSSQLQIACAYPSAPFGDPHYYTAKVSSGLLSGGMFGRLFIEVREKRGLCYSVFARHSANKNYGTMMAYAGTTPDRADETLEVMIKELRGASEGITAEELDRAKANLKASLVIGEESSGARAGSNASEWWLNRKVRSLDEILAEVNRVTAKDVQAYLDAYPPKHFTLMTLGSRQPDAKAAGL